MLGGPSRRPAPERARLGAGMRLILGARRPPRRRAAARRLRLGLNCARAAGRQARAAGRRRQPVPIGSDILRAARPWLSTGSRCSGPQRLPALGPAPCANRVQTRRAQATGRRAGAAPLGCRRPCGATRAGSASSLTPRQPRRAARRASGCALAQTPPVERPPAQHWRMRGVCDWVCQCETGLEGRTPWGFSGMRPPDRGAVDMALHCEQVAGTAGNAQWRAAGHACKPCACAARRPRPGDGAPRRTPATPHHQPAPDQLESSHLLGRAPTCWLGCVASYSMSSGRSLRRTASGAQRRPAASTHACTCGGA